jgi:hypothetical protein
MHWQMKIPDSMESFYAQRSSKTRQTLKRYSRQVEKKFQIQLIGCISEDSLSKILSEAASVSSRTYQHALGWGLTDDVATRQKLIAASRNSAAAGRKVLCVSAWFSVPGHILSADDGV